MVDKHKISAPHEDTLRNAPHPVQSKLSAGQLDTIYRAPKTREQLRQDDAKRQALFRSRVPRFIILKITVLASGLLAALLTFIVSIEKMWTSGGDSALMGLSGVSLSFTLLVALMIAYYLLYGYFDRIFTLVGRSQRVFFSAYAGVVIISVASGILLTMTFAWQGSTWWILVAVAVHALLLAGVLAFMLRHAGDVDV